MLVFTSGLPVSPQLSSLFQVKAAQCEQPLGRTPKATGSSRCEVEGDKLQRQGVQGSDILVSLKDCVSLLMSFSP